MIFSAFDPDPEAKIAIRFIKNFFGWGLFNKKKNNNPH
jgi:hypothetical protein